jgi:hypothetical protein
MILKNVSARLHNVNGRQLAPGQTIEVPDGQGELLMAATRGKNARPQSGELVQGDPPMPAAAIRTIADLPEDVALQLVDRASLDSLAKLAADEKRPEVLSAIAKRKRG